jgi:hypothetical protein
LGALRRLALRSILKKYDVVIGVGAEISSVIDPSLTAESR